MAGAVSDPGGGAAADWHVGRFAPRTTRMAGALAGCAAVELRVHEAGCSARSTLRF